MRGLRVSRLLDLERDLRAKNCEAILPKCAEKVKKMNHKAGMVEEWMGKKTEYKKSVSGDRSQ
jgi:hypothetical protein